MIVVAVMLYMTAGAEEIYKNQEFGIVLSVPERLLLCPRSENEHDHGPVMLLSPASLSDCQNTEATKYIEVFASYNVSDDTKKVHEFLQWECVHVAGGPCEEPPRGLRVRYLRSEAARVGRAGGWVDVIVVTQAGAPDPTFDSSAPSINYELRLHTTSEQLSQDLETFRTVLKVIKLSPAPRHGRD